MFLHNPIGLLGLLALPTIVVLHYFRSQQRKLRIGGLHLWEFARRRQPVGRRRQRLESSAPLLLQLLAAALTSLLLAGLTLDLRGEREHFAVILDGSASMEGVNPSTGNSPRQEAVEAIRAHADEHTEWTIVEAGLEPRLLAGPHASASETLRALGAWRAEAPASDLAPAFALALKLADPDQEILWLSDRPLAVSDEGELVRLRSGALGEPAPNGSIAFADRTRLSTGDGEGDHDRLFLVLRHDGIDAVETSLTIEADGQTLASRSVEMAPGSPKRLELEVPRVPHPIRVSLGRDALAIDNAAWLAPVPSRRQAVYAELPGAAATQLYQAVDAVPECYRAPSADAATVVFLASAAEPSDALAAQLGDRYPRALALVVVPQAGDNAAVSLAQESFVPTRAGVPLLRGLSYEGLLWPYLAARERAPTTLLHHGAASLLEQRENARDQIVLALNALLDVGNITRSTFWPLFVYNVVELGRARIPGPQRANVRLGEEVVVWVGRQAARRWVLEAEGQPPRDFQPLPPRLTSLRAGLHHLKLAPDDTVAAEQRVDYTFAVNFASAEESNLLGRSRSAPDWDNLGQSAAAREASRPILFYALLALAALVLAILWRLQEGHP